MSEENIPQVINDIITPPTPSNVPLYVFLMCFGIWAYTISLNKKSWSPKWDDLIVSIIILIPLFFIAKCTISGNCGLILMSASAIVLGYSIYSAYKNFKTDEAASTETPTAATPTETR